MGCLTSKDIPYKERCDDNEQRETPQSLTQEQKTNNKNIDKYMEYQRQVEMRIKKMLLLGAGSSGKSTLFKQLKQIYKYGLDESEYLESKYVIRSNCIASILTLLKKSQVLYEMNPDLHSDCYVPLNDANQQLIHHIQTVLRFAMPNREELDQESCAFLLESISYLWAIPQVRNTFTKRQYFSFVENMDYFFAKLEDIFCATYAPSLQDTLKCRIRTTGLIEEKYIINDVQFNIFDAGGQRTERKKWIALFEGVTAVIFVAALNHYATVLFEDESKNSMHESLELFDEICNQKWFRKTEIILFLNKADLFEQRLREGISLSVAFGNRWKGPDYEPREDPTQDEEEFMRCFDEAVAFVRQQYEMLNRNPYKKIYSHTTTATNKDNIESVFWDVQNIIVARNMNSSGLV
eukprot:59004_1